MARKRFSVEQIIAMLREAEVRLAQGQTIGLICKGFGVTEGSLGTDLGQANPEGGLGGKY